MREPDRGGLRLLVPSAVAVPVLAAAVLSGELGAVWPTVLLAGVAAGATLCRRPPLASAAAFAVAYAAVAEWGTFSLNGSGATNVTAVFCVGGAAAVLAHALGAARSVTGLVVMTVALLCGGVNPLPAAVVIGMWSVGLAVRSQRALVGELETRAAELAAERAAHVSQAVRYERAKLARELHDVIGHGMSIIVIQAGAGRLLAASQDPGATEDMLDAVVDAVREVALDVSSLGALPGSGLPVLRERLDALAATLRRAGVRLDLAIVGDPVRVPTAVAATAYRVVQEGVTNALRHAPGAAVAVALDCGPPVRVSIANEASHRPAVDLGSGRGLAGLAERVSAVSGCLSAGRTPSGGWQVVAELPGEEAGAWSAARCPHRP